MALSPSHLSQIGIPVRDLEAAKRFYGESLGLAHLFDAPPGLSFYQCGQTRLMLSQSEGSDTDAGVILYYDVPDARAAQAELAAAGCTFHGETRCIARVGDKDVWLAITNDGQGNHVGLMSHEPAAD
jgi:methylmalonyl-CoA/ethylmalonyl-CoA epimerase